MENRATRLRAALFQNFRWKILALRILVNALALIIVALVVPNIYFVDKTLRSALILAIMLGVLNAIVKPIVQFLTLPFLFASYGLIVVFINALLLFILSARFPQMLAVRGLLWALVGGAVIGLVSSFFENLLGLTPPIHPDAPGAGLTAPPPLAGRVVASLGGPQPSFRTSPSVIEPATPTPEVTNETIIAGQDQGEPAATAGL